MAAFAGGQEEAANGKGDGMNWKIKTSIMGSLYLRPQHVTNQSFRESKVSRTLTKPDLIFALKKLL